MVIGGLRPSLDGEQGRSRHRHSPWLLLSLLSLLTIVAWAWGAHATIAHGAGSSGASRSASSHPAVTVTSSQQAVSLRRASPLRQADELSATDDSVPASSASDTAGAAAIATPAPAPPPPPPPHNRLISSDGTLNVGVGLYTDCSGQSPLTRVIAAIDTCVTDTTYFTGHNPGVFTPLMSMAVGSVITWYDNAGAAHPLRVAAVHSWLRANGVPPPSVPGVVAQFQTCITLDGSVDNILDAVVA